MARPRSWCPHASHPHPKEPSRTVTDPTVDLGSLTALLWQVRKLLIRAEALLGANDSQQMTDIQRTLLSTTYNNMACHLKRCNKPHAAVQYLHKAP